MITVHQLCLSYGTQTLFNNALFTIDQNDRIGLVGRNGSGKSTLLKLLAGLEQADSGTIARAKNKTIAYLPQEVVLHSDKSILEETFSTFEQLYKLKKEAEKLEPLLEQKGVSTDQKIIDRYVHIQEQLIEHDPDAALAETKKVLMGLGFQQEQFDQPVENLSVGWKMRIVLAKLLLKKADLYLFDEPTNHLDIVAKDWFLSFLKEADFGFILVCHERYALDFLVNNILELEIGNATMYASTFSVYEKEKEHRLAILEQAQKQQQKEITRKMKTIERFKAKANKASMAKSMLKSIEKIELISLSPELKTMQFSFPPTQRAGRIVLEVNNVAHSFGDRQIVKNISFHVERGQKIAIIAPNGVGKTTLFNLIVGKLSLQNGTIKYGYNVKAAIFDQDQTKALDLGNTVLENTEDRCPPESRAKMRNFLGAFLFSGKEVDKKVSVLSGGEKNRVGMVNVLLQNANLLLLDEPTNHLDIPSKEILLNALQQYPGTLLFVSHDHDFINKLATHVIELSSDGIIQYEGNYTAFQYYKKQLASQQQPQQNSAQQKHTTKNRPQYNQQTRKQIKSIERKISKLEQEIKKTEQNFLGLEYSDSTFFTAEQKLQKLKQELKTAETEWEQLQQ